MKKLLLNAALAAMVAIAGAVFSSEPIGPMHMTSEAQLTGQNRVGLVPEGLRIDSYSTGVFTDGLLAGATYDGIDYVLIRHDGVAVLYGRYYAVVPDGATVAFTLRGFMGEPTPGLLEAMLDPAYEPPDVDIPWHGAFWFETMAPQYAFLNHTIFAGTATLNLATGVLLGTLRPIAE